MTCTTNPGWPRISVITPSFNQGEFIEATIKSVMGQGYPNLEYLVVDGGSTDGTLDILRKYSGYLSWTSELDRGQTNAINKGLARATGDVLAYLNSDDLYLPGALHRVADFFTDNPEAAWVTGRCITIDANQRETRKLITLYKNIWLRLGSYKILQVLNYISQPATFWRRSVFEEFGFLNESLHYTMDYEYWLRIGHKHRLWVLPYTLAYFRIHPNSKSGSTGYHQFAEQYEVAKSYRPSSIFLRLHAMHNSLSISIYNQILPIQSSSENTLTEIK